MQVGDNEITLVGLLSVLIVSGQKFIIALTYVINLWINSLFKLVPWFLSIELRILLHELICLSQSLPMWLAASEFFKNVTQSTLKLGGKNVVILFCYFVNTFFNSLSLPIKLVLLSHLMNCSAWLTSGYCAYHLRSFLPTITKNGPNKCNPQHVKGDISFKCSIGSSFIFCTINVPLTFLYVTYWYINPH